MVAPLCEHSSTKFLLIISMSILPIKKVFSKQSISGMTFTYDQHRNALSPAAESQL